MTCFNTLTPKQRKLILRHLDLVIEANKKVNLTRIDDYESARLLHIEDSLSALPELSAAPKGLYGDLGTGAGFPGIPLSIASNRQSLLIDARKKKIKMLEEMIDELGLNQQIETFAGRAELLARKTPDLCSVLTARALSRLSVLLELASPLLKHEGVLICYKANIDDDEMNHALQVQEATGMSFLNQRSFLLNEAYQRTIVTFKKTAQPKLSLPRLEGQAQKNPI